MGNWGTGIYQNDTAEDVKTEYKTMLQQGKSDEAALQAIIERYSEEICDPDDATDFWLALADTQWRLGRLDDDVKQKALNCIDTEDTDYKYNEFGKNGVKRRKTTLEALRVNLLSPQPSRKKISICQVYRCKWKIGDVYALKLTSSKAEANGLSGQYLLVHKVDEFEWDSFPNNLNPIVRIKITNNYRLPKDIDEFNALEYVQIWGRPYALRFCPGNGSLSPEEDLKERQSLRCIPDETGCLPEFLVKLLITSERVIPKRLFYVANFQGVASPVNEFIPRGGSRGLGGFLIKNIENEIIANYLRYNKREA